ncbi:MAG: hypothetical protein P8Y47_04885 [Alphaproteobacteria bacterium]
MTAIKDENDVRNAIVKTALTYGVMLWRNNSGALRDARGKFVRFGLGNISKKANDEFKTSDLIGIGPDGTFWAIEVKKPDWKPGATAVKAQTEAAQQRFLDIVVSKGGVGFFASSVEQAVAEFDKRYPKKQRKIVRRVA